MRILFLTQVLPFPPDAGPRVKTGNVLRSLVRSGHEVHLASFMRPEERPHLNEVRRLCASVSAVPMKRSWPRDAFAWARSNLTGRPFLVERDDVRAMRQQVREIVEARRIEAVHADQLSMAQFAVDARELPSDSPLLVFDAHNAVWKVVERMKSQLPPLLRRVIELEARRTKVYEGQIVRKFDWTLAVSGPDRAALLEAGQEGVNGSTRSDLRERIVVVPIGVDTNGRPPVATNPRSHKILALGTLHYPPNADGVRWFARSIYPHIRAADASATLTIVGKNPPADIVDLGNGPSIEVTGYVADLTEILESAALMVVPVRAGGGMRVRILEGFAWGIPMVTTTLGLEGIDARPGRDVLVADSADEFAHSVVQVLRDPELRADLVYNGRLLVEQRYDWKVALRTLSQVYSPEQVAAHAP